PHHLPARRARERDEPERAVETDAALHQPVLETRHLRPAGTPLDMEGVLAAVSVGDVREHHLSFARELDLRDAREPAPHLVPIRALRRAELVSPYLLEESEVSVRALPF